MIKNLLKENTGKYAVVFGGTYLEMGSSVAFLRACFQGRWYLLSFEKFCNLQ